MGARHLCKIASAFEADGEMTEVGERLEVAAGAATEIQNAKRCGAFNVTEEGTDILGDIVVAGPAPKGFRMAIVVAQSACADGLQIFLAKLHISIVRADKLERQP